MYTDSQFTTPVLVPVVSMTATVAQSGTGTITTANYVPLANLPVFVRRTKIANVSINVVTAPVATGGVLNFLNGTNTFATATIGTLTAGQNVQVAANSNGTFAAAAGPSVTFVGTGTNASGGGYAIWFDQQELYA